MSLQTAMQVLETAPIPQEKTVQPPEQEVKETATDGSQQSAPPKQGEGEAAPIKTEAEKSPEAPKKEDPPISSKFAALAKKEKALQQKSVDLKTREAETEKRLAEISAREQKIASDEKLWQENVFEALRAKGYTYQQLTDMILSGKQVAEKPVEDPVTVAKRVADELRAEFAAKEKAREETAKKAEEDRAASQKAALDAAYAQYRTEIKEYTDAHPDECELINLYEQQDLVLSTVESYFEEHKKALSVQEATEMVEKYLLSEAQKAQKSKKLSGTKATPPEPKSAPAPKKDEEPRIQTSKTLTNNLTPTAASSLPAATERDRMERAMRALERKQP